MISSRLAEPETADLWALKMVEFCMHNQSNINLSMKKSQLVKHNWKMAVDKALNDGD